MISEEHLKEIKEHLERAQNPLFYYDNDADGFCSYIIFRRFIDRGKGVAIRSYPDMNEDYARKAEELNADYVFILDKPLVSDGFIKRLNEKNIPIVWIDHHDLSLEKKGMEGLSIYNPLAGDLKSEEPVSYWAYKCAGNKESVWLAMMGCVADHHLPDFKNDFLEIYGDMWASGIKVPFDAYYKSQIGEIARIVNFGLKDSITNVVAMQNYFIKCKNPREVLEDDDSKKFLSKYKDLKKRNVVLIEKAEECRFGKLIFFDYGGETSMSSDLANELIYRNKTSFIAVAFIKGAIANVSLRGDGVKKVLDKIIVNFEGATGGGHEDAVGARIKTEHLAKFREALEKEVNK